VKREFNELFPAIRVLSYEYPLDEQTVIAREGDENKEGIGHWISRDELKGGVEFRMSAHISTPGKVEIRYSWYGGGMNDPGPRFTHHYSQRTWI
jgi:hypothetical protein